MGFINKTNCKGTGALHVSQSSAKALTSSCSHKSWISTPGILPQNLPIETKGNSKLARVKFKVQIFCTLNATFQGNLIWDIKDLN